MMKMFIYCDLTYFFVVMLYLVVLRKPILFAFFEKCTANK